MHTFHIAELKIVNCDKGQKVFERALPVTKYDKNILQNATGIGLKLYFQHFMDHPFTENDGFTLLKH